MSERAHEHRCRLDEIDHRIAEKYASADPRDTYDDVLLLARQREVVRSHLDIIEAMDRARRDPVAVTYG